MKRLTSLPILIILTLYTAISQASELNDQNIRSDRDTYSSLMFSGRYHDALRYSRNMLKEADSTEDIHRLMLACSCLGQAYIAMDTFDSAYIFLDHGLRLWNSMDSTDRSHNDYFTIYSIYSCLGIYEISTGLNYEKAIAHFLNGMRTALSHGDYSNYAVLGSNLTRAFVLRRDTSGLRYAKEIYGLGTRLDDPYIKHIGASVCANMYFLRDDIPQARKYMDETMMGIEDYYDKAEAYRLNAAILTAEGKTDEARAAYRNAIASINDESTITAISVYLSYACFLKEQGQPGEAMRYIDKGISLSRSRGNRIFTAELYATASQLEEAMGNYPEALKYYKDFHQESSDLDAIEQERTIGSLKSQFEKEKHLREIQQVRRIAGIIIMVVAAGLVITWIMYRNKNRMYTRIARQYKESVTKEQAMEKQIEQLTANLEAASAPAPDTSKYSNSSLTTDNGRELYSRLEHLMKYDRLYREKNLTRERIAELLGSNRTYLTQVIHENTGRTLLSYINSYRINEAITILSDPANDIPLKALCSDLGFNSSTTFYKLFQNKVGMTPAKYREKIIEISNRSNCPD